MSTTTDTPLISGNALRKSFARTEAVRGVSLTVASGEVVAITGPSGSGKSTLMHCLAGILRPEAGEVTFAGERIDLMSETQRSLLRRREFGIVLQFGQLLPELTALQNVALPLLLNGHDRRASEGAARGWLERLGVLDEAEASSGEMSGGEQQRVAVARALVTGPRVVFADEPTGALDTLAGEHVLAELVGAIRDTGAALIMITHDNRVAARADREIALEDGRIANAQVGG